MIMLNKWLQTLPNQNVIDSKHILIKDPEKVINIIEPILFDIYGKDDIINERPYSIIFVNNYWVVSGSMPNLVCGGTFEVIMDARNCEIIHIMHGE